MSNQKNIMLTRLKAYQLLMEDPEFRDRYARVTAKIAILERDLYTITEYVDLVDVRVGKALRDLKDIKDMLDQDQKKLYHILNNGMSDNI